MNGKQIGILLLLILQASTRVSAHELNFGLFELFEKEQSYYMEIRLDKANMAQAVANHTEVTSGDWNCSLSQYLDANIDLVINGFHVPLEFEDFTYLDDVIVVMVKLNLPLQEILEIEINNSVLLETIDNQTNIIKTSFHEKRRSFRLNKDRVFTTIKYQI